MPKPRTSKAADFATEQLSAYIALVERTVEVFGDEVKASLWLSTPSNDFGGVSPLAAAAKRDYDVQYLDPFLVRIEHGIYF